MVQAVTVGVPSWNDLAAGTSGPPAFLNVMDFGAKGNGIADDTAAIQAALNAANAAGGGTVFAPVGTYLQSTRLLQYPNINFVGAGRNATILFSPNVGHDGINAESYCRIANMTIRGPSSSPGSGIGIDCGSTNFLVLENLIVEAWPGDNINSGGTSGWWTIQNVVSRNSGGEGVLITGGSNYWHIDNFTAYGNRYNAIDMNGVGHTLSNIVLYQNGGSGPSALDQDGILIVSDAGTPVTSDITITNLYCYQNNTHGVRIETSPATVIKRVTISNLVSSQNGVGDGSSNPANRFGAGLIIFNTNVGTFPPGEAIEDISVSNAIFDNNYQYGLEVVSNPGNNNPVQRLSFEGISAVNHTGWTGSGGAGGIYFYGTHLFKVKCSGNAVGNTHNIVDPGLAFVDGETSMNVQTDDPGGISSKFTLSPGRTTSGPGMQITSGQNTALGLHSTGTGYHDWAWVISSGGGGFIELIDTTANEPYIICQPQFNTINMYQPVEIQSTANTFLYLLSTGTGVHNFGLSLDQFGNFLIADLTASGSPTRLKIDAAGNVTVPAALSVGGGSFLAKYVSVQVALNFPAIPANSAVNLTGTATGMVQAYPVIVAPDAATASMLGVTWYAKCDLNDQVTVRFINFTTATVTPPASSSFICTQFR